MIIGGKFNAASYNMAGNSMSIVTMKSSVGSGGIFDVCLSIVAAGIIQWREF
jgi:hypothetical protein